MAKKRSGNDVIECKFNQSLKLHREWCSRIRLDVMNMVSQEKCQERYITVSARLLLVHLGNKGTMSKQ